MKKILVIASNNKDKMREIEEIFRDTSYEVKRAADLGETLDIVEDGDTFAANALLKVQAYREIYPEYSILADDSGLVIDALDGRPGVYSARYAGVDSTYDVKINQIWQELRNSGVEEDQWTARFVCAVAFWDQDEEAVQVFEGVMEGKIAKEQRGEHGFGYDPIFYLPEYSKTSAEISPEEKNRISHRGKALAKLHEYLHK